MRAKKLINDPLKVTVEELEGFASAYSYIVRRVGTHAIVRRDVSLQLRWGEIEGEAGGRIS